MRTYDAPTLSHLQTRGGKVAKTLFQVIAEGEFFGLWNDVDYRTFTVDGVSRQFVGAGTLIQSDPLVVQTGLNVRVHTVELSSVSQQVEDLIKGYNTRFAPAAIYRVFLNPVTRLPVSDPHREFKGFINTVTFKRPEPGGLATCTVELASESRALTRKLVAKQSHKAQQLRSGDMIRRYNDFSGVFPVFWGQKWHWK